MLNKTIPIRAYNKEWSLANGGNNVLYSSNLLISTKTII